MVGFLRGRVWCGWNEAVFWARRLCGVWSVRPEWRYPTTSSFISTRNREPMGKALVLLNPKVTPHVPTRPYISILPKMFRQMGTNYSNKWDCGDNCHPNHDRVEHMPIKYQLFIVIILRNILCISPFTSPKSWRPSWSENRIGQKGCVLFLRYIHRYMFDT